MSARFIRQINWAACLLAAAWLLLVATTVTPAIDDFEQYWQAALNIRLNGNPYATTPEPGITPDPNAPFRAPFPNPPLLAYLMLPFSFVSAETGLQIWFWLNIAMLAGLIALCINLSGSVIVQRWWGIVVLLTVLAPPTRVGLQLGQVSILLALLAVAAFWCTHKRANSVYHRGTEAPSFFRSIQTQCLRVLCGDSFLAGLLLALGALIKLYPGLLGLYFLRHGPRRVVGWALAIGIVILLGSLWLFGLLPYQQYLHKVLLGGYYPYAAEFNISLVGFFQRLLVPSRFAIAVADLPMVAWGLAWVSSLVVLAGCWLVGAGGTNQALALVRYSVYICAMLLIAPVNGFYNLVALLLPALAGVRALELSPNPQLRVWLVVGLVLACIPPGWANGLPIYEWLHTGWGIVLLSPALYGVAIVFGVLVALGQNEVSARTRQ